MRPGMGVQELATMVLCERRKDLKNAEERVLAAPEAKVAPPPGGPGPDRASRGD